MQKPLKYSVQSEKWQPGASAVTKFHNHILYQKNAGDKGTVQRKLTWVKSGINRQLMICQSVAWYFFLNLKSLGPLNSKKRSTTSAIPVIAECNAMGSLLLQNFKNFNFYFKIFKSSFHRVVSFAVLSLEFLTFRN
jgi:hypothetical protein